MIKTRGGLGLIALSAIFLTPLLGQQCLAQSKATVPTTTGTSETAVETEAKTKISDVLGISYFMFINGPGLDPDKRDATPNQLGNASDNGLHSFNVISFKYKFSKKMALDFQTRSALFFNSRDPWSEREKRSFTDGEPTGFSNFRWESPRIGISGKLASGSDWALTGAVNSDFPYVLPEPFTGYTAQKRTVLFSPGMFANFSYNPSGSRWSVFSILSPRMFFYSDKEAVTPEELRGGFNWKNKPEFIVALSPTLNYAVSEKVSASLGTSLDLRKQLGSTWNPTDVTLANNGESEAWRLMALPVSLGMTYEMNSAFRVFPYVQAFPIAAQRINASNGNQASFLETASIGLWVSGTIL